VSGFRNRDLRTYFFAVPAQNPFEERRRSAWMSRKLRLLARRSDPQNRRTPAINSRRWPESHHRHTLRSTLHRRDLIRKR